jgi:hypothetical protein
MPLPFEDNPKDTIWYFSANPRNWVPEKGKDNWSQHENDAVALWELLEGYTSISLGWLEGPKRWLALYSKALIDDHHYRPRQPVVARFGRSPVTLASSDEITLFDACRDWAYGNYMDWPDDDVPGWPYGAFIIPPLTQWDPPNRTICVHYLLSTSRPYQVQLMRSRFHLPWPSSTN